MASTTPVYFTSTTADLFLNLTNDVSFINVFLGIIVVILLLDFFRRILMPRAW